MIIEKIIWIADYNGVPIVLGISIVCMIFTRFLLKKAKLKKDVSESVKNSKVLNCVYISSFAIFLIIVIVIYFHIEQNWHCNKNWDFKRKKGIYSSLSLLYICFIFALHSIEILVRMVIMKLRNLKVSSTEHTQKARKSRIHNKYKDGS